MNMEQTKAFYHPQVDVCIPAYKPGKRFRNLLLMLKKQTYPIRKIIIVNTERAFWDPENTKDIRGIEVHHITRQEFDHGATRNLLAWYSEAEVMVFMTDDAMPADENLISNLVEALGTPAATGEVTAMAYARQLPCADCRRIERLTRAFNYGEEPIAKTKKDLERLGIKTFFASNVCCAYRKEIFDLLEGFTNTTIFNEDMIYASGVIRAGYAIRYVPGARVYHSHNLSMRQQFQRNFDLAVSQADHPEVFAGIPSEGEGIRMVKKTAMQLLAKGRFWLIPSLVLGSGAKYAGYFLGKRYRRLPHKLILACSMSPIYWEKKWRKQK